MLLSLSASLLACAPSTKNVTTVTTNDAQLMICDESKLGEKREIKFSELLEDFEVIRFDNADEALFKWRWFFFSENYICVRQDQAPVKLFDKSGKFVANVGQFGRGPGEYTSVVDIIIDEAGKGIYLTSMSSQSVLKYDMAGKFVEAINLDDKANKARMALQPNSVLSLVHFCFKDIAKNKFTIADIQLDKNDSIEYIYNENIASNLKNDKGQNTGFNGEIWSYRNVPGLSFSMTHADTIYNYNAEKNQLNACFALDMEAEKRKGHFIIFNELPNHYLALVMGKDSKTILVDKDDEVAYESSFVNDFMGNLDTPLKFQDGYFFATFEPLILKDKIDKHLSSGACPTDQVEKLTKLKESLKDEDNNVLFLAKLKK